MSLIRFYLGCRGFFLPCRGIMKYIMHITAYRKAGLRRLYSKISSTSSDIDTQIGKNSTKKVVAFYLQYQPEASTMPKGGVFHDQLKIIEYLSFKKNIKLIVREHPNQFSRSYARQPEVYRTKDFYKKNVYWHSLDESPYELFNIADIVVSVGGTVLLEAAIRGIPAISLGDNFFNDIDGIQRVHSYSELDLIVMQVSDSANINLTKQKIDINNIEKYTFPAVIGGNINIDQIGLTEEQNYENLKQAFIEFFKSS